MKRRSVFLVTVALLATALVGLRPTPASASAGEVQSMAGTMDLSPPPPLAGSFCATFSGPVLMTVSTTQYTGPVAGTASGTVCGSVPGPVTGTMSFSGSANLGVVTVTMSCTGTLVGSIPGTITYKLSCVLTVVTPFGTTTQTFCVTGQLILLLTPGVFVGAGVSPC